MPRTTTASTASSGPRPLQRALVLLLLVALVVAPPAAGLLEIDVTDGVVSEQTARPDASDPGPIFFDTGDGLSFSTGLTDLETIWSADLTVANNTSASGATVQGEAHTFRDWFYGRQGSAGRFASFGATGTYDSDAAAYLVPSLFTKSSQGTLTLRSYSAADPVNDSTSATFYWAYDATANRYVLGTGKDLSLETSIAPVSDASGTAYSRTLETNAFVVTGVGAAPDYLPTVKQGVHFPLLSLPGTVTWYLLMDPPAGVHEDTYSYVLQVTAQAL